MYNAPPGLEGDKKNYGEDGEEGGEDGNDIHHNSVSGDQGNQISLEQKVGDDDAAAAFRQMLAGNSTYKNQDDE